LKLSFARQRGARDARPRRLTDSARVRRRRAFAGLVLLVLGLVSLVFGIVSGRTDPPPPVQLLADGVTEVPETHFYQSPWVLFGELDDPRRPPTTAEVGCLPQGSMELPAQPADMTEYGARVVDDVPVAAIALYGRSGSDASVRCEAAADYEPLWLMPASDARPFTSTGIAILGLLLIVAAALTHPSTIDRPTQWWVERSRRRARNRSGG
jgi:hypothetical protein